MGSIKLRIMLSYKEAFSLIKEQFQNLKLETENVKLENSLHRTLAENVISDINLPPFDNSAVDGYVVQFDDSINEWEMIGDITAGNFKEFNLTENQTVKIMTGAKIPFNCNAVSSRCSRTKIINPSRATPSWVNESKILTNLSP